MQELMEIERKLHADNANILLQSVSNLHFTDQEFDAQMRALFCERLCPLMMSIFPPNHFRSRMSSVVLLMERKNDRWHVIDAALGLSAGCMQREKERLRKWRRKKLNSGFLAFAECKQRPGEFPKGNCAEPSAVVRIFANNPAIRLSTNSSDFKLLSLALDNEGSFRDPCNFCYRCGFISLICKDVIRLIKVKEGENKPKYKPNDTANQM